MSVEPHRHLGVDSPRVNIFDLKGINELTLNQGDIFYIDNNGFIANLGAGISGQVLRTAGAAANPLWGNPVDLSITGQAQGDVLYFNGTNWVRLAAGTSGNFLQTQGAGANPLWAASGGATLIGTAPARLTIANTAAETDVINVTLNGGSLSTGNFAEIFVTIETLSLNAGAGATATWRLYYGAAPAVATMTMATGAASLTGKLYAQVFANGATNAQSNRIWCWLASGADSADITQFFNKDTDTTSVVDSTVNQTFKLTFQPSVARADTGFVRVGAAAVLYR